MNDIASFAIRSLKDTPTCDIYLSGRLLRQTHPYAIYECALAHTR